MSKPFGKTCRMCKKPIELSDKSGRWLPYNLDGTQHFCRKENGHESENKPLTVEARLDRLERIVLDSRK